MIEEVKIIEKSEEYIAYDCGSVLYICLDKGGTVSDHTHDHQEVVFLLQGEAEITIGDDKQIIKIPSKITIPANTYHKFTALTDVIGLEIK